MHFLPIFSCKLAITEIRLTLPQRSPKPLIVPCTWVAPISTAGQRVGHRQLAVVVAVNAQRRLDRPGSLARAHREYRLAVDPPLVSQRTIQSAPPSCAALRHSSA